MRALEQAEIQRIKMEGKKLQLNESRMREDIDERKCAGEERRVVMEAAAELELKKMKVMMDVMAKKVKESC